MVEIRVIWVIILSVLSGFAVGGTVAVARLYGIISTMERVERMLSQFKAEGHEEKWLK